MQDSKKYYEKFNINPEKYKEFLLEDTELPPRVINACFHAGIKTVSDLLFCSARQFFFIRNIGEHSINDIENFFSKLHEFDYDEKEYRASRKAKIPYKIYKNRFNIINGDLSFMNGKKYTKKEYAILKKYIESIYVLGSELLELCYTNPQKAQKIRHALFVFSYKLDIEKKKRQINEVNNKIVQYRRMN